MIKCGWNVRATHSIEDIGALTVLDAAVLEPSPAGQKNTLMIDASGWRDIPSISFERICGAIEECNYDSVSLSLRDARVSAEMLQGLSVAISLNSSLSSFEANFTNCQGVGDKNSMSVLATTFSLNSCIRELHLGLRYCNELSDDSIFWFCEAVQDRLTSISLDLEYCFSLTDRSLEIIGCLITRSKGLEHLSLNLNGTCVSDEGIHSLCAAVFLLRLESFSLSISSCEEVSELGLVQIAKCMEHVKYMRIHIGFSARITDASFAQFFEELNPNRTHADSVLSLVIDSVDSISSESFLRSIWKCAVKKEKEFSKIKLAVSRCKGFTNAVQTIKKLVEEHDEFTYSQLEFDLFHQQLSLDSSAGEGLKGIMGQPNSTTNELRLVMYLSAHQKEIQAMIGQDGRVEVVIGESPEDGKQRLNEQSSSKIVVVAFSAATAENSQVNCGEIGVTVLEAVSTTSSDLSIVIDFTSQEKIFNSNSDQNTRNGDEHEKNEDIGYSICREVEKLIRVIAKGTSQQISKVAMEISGDSIIMNGSLMRAVLESLRWLGSIELMEVELKNGSRLSENCLNEIGKAICLRVEQVVMWQLRLGNCSKITDGALVGFASRLREVKSCTVHATLEECEDISDAAIIELGRLVVQGENPSKQIHMKFINASRITDKGLEQTQKACEDLLDEKKNTLVEMMFVLCPLLSIKRIVALQKYLRSLQEDQN